MKIKVKAKPNCRIESIKKIDPEYYEIKVSPPPEKGKANTRIIELLSEYLHIQKSKISLIKGSSAKVKTFEIEN